MPISLKLASGGGGFKNKVLITSSGNWTVPANVYQIEVIATAGGGCGGGADSNPNAQGGAGGGAGATIGSSVLVAPNEVLQIIIGAGGLGVVGLGGNSGGNTLVRKNDLPIINAKGGDGGNHNSTAAGQGSSVGAALDPTKLVGGGSGSAGTLPNGVAASSGSKPKVLSGVGIFSGIVDSSAGAAGGAGGTVRGAGGAGGSSIYGNGGAGGNGSNSAGASTTGLTPVSTNYGAGGGGAAGATTGSVAGGNGIQGVVEIYY